MARKIKPIDLCRAEELTKKEASLARAKKRLAKLEAQVTQLSTEVKADVSETLQPGWYEKQPNYQYDEPEHILVLKVKRKNNPDRHDAPYEVRYVDLEVGKFGERVIYLDQNGQEQTTTGKVHGCKIDLIDGEMSYKVMTKLSPIPSLQLLVKFGLTDALIRANMPKSNQQARVLCDIGGSWCRVVGIVSTEFYDLFDE